MSSAHRKFESGSQKRKKKQRIEKLVQSQQGAMDMFITKPSQVSSDNPTPDNDPIDPPENNVEVEEALPDNTNTQIGNNSEDLNPSLNVGDSFLPDIFDPRYWDSLDSKQVDIWSYFFYATGPHFLVSYMASNFPGTALARATCAAPGARADHARCLCRRGLAMFAAAM
jgi:hypothetical protein